MSCHGVNSAPNIGPGVISDPCTSFAMKEQVQPIKNNGVLHPSGVKIDPRTC